MRRQGVRVETIRAADHDIATGVWPDMTEHGAASDAWPQLYTKVLAADILVLAGPICLGDNSFTNRNTTFMTWNLGGRRWRRPGPRPAGGGLPG